jgi:hypothetical protein
MFAVATFTSKRAHKQAKRMCLCRAVELNT